MAKYNTRLRVFIVCTAFALMGATCKQSAQKPAESYKPANKIDSLKRALDSTVKLYAAELAKRIDPAARQLQNDSSAHGTIYIINPKEEQKNDWRETAKTYIPWALALISLLVAYYGFMRTSRFKSFDFLGDVNKLNIDKPDLNMFYDIHYDTYASAEKADNTSGSFYLPAREMLERRLRSFAYFKLNNFESTFQNFKWFGFSKDFYTWKKFLVYTLCDSRIFRKIAKEAVAEGLFGYHFTRQLRKSIDIAEALAGDKTGWKSIEITAKETNKNYESQLKKHFWTFVWLYIYRFNKFCTMFKWQIVLLLVAITGIFFYYFCYR